MLSEQQEDELAIYRYAQEMSYEDPEWFFVNVLNFKSALPWQIKACNVVLDVRRKKEGRPTMYNHDGKPRLSIRSCHGTGKTQFLGLLIHLWNFITYGKIACTAPKEAQLTKRLLPRYRDCMRGADEVYKSTLDVQGKEIVVYGDKDWGANMETASDPDNLAGYHDKPQLFVIDEGSAKRLDPMYPVIEGALTFPGSVVVEIGNPTRVEGEFYTHHNVPDIMALYYLMHIKYTDAKNLISKEWVDSMRVKYGENSPVFKIRVAGEFAAFDEYILIQPEYIEDSLDREEVPDGSIPVLKVSVDVADGGADSTVITVSRVYESFMQILKQKAFYFESSLSIPLGAKAAIEMFEGFGGDKHSDLFIVDALGVGAGVAGILMEKGYNVIRNVGGSTEGVDTERFRNRRVQNYITLHEYYQQDKIRVSPDAIDDEEELRAHLLSIKRNKDNEKVDDIEPKKKIKQDGLPSPDRADSMAQLLNGEEPTAGVPMTVPEVVGQSIASQFDGGLS